MLSGGAVTSESRAPHGARGLKQLLRPDDVLLGGGRAPHGARGLKRLYECRGKRLTRRAPHGARGLKLILLGDCPRPVTSRPAWGAWIETYAVIACLAR